MITITIYNNRFSVNYQPGNSASERDKHEIMLFSRQMLYYKNPLICDAELLFKLKKWPVPRYIPRQMLIGTPTSTGFEDIPMGMLPGTIEYFKSQKILCKLTPGPKENYDERNAYTIKCQLLKKELDEKDTILRNYQLDAAKDLSKMRFGQAVSMTGSGKTVIMSALIAHYGIPTVVLCHRRILVYQWEKAIQKICGKKPYVLCEGKLKKGDAPILVTTLQSIGTFSKKSEKTLLTARVRDEINGMSVANAKWSEPYAFLKGNKIDSLKKAGFDIKAFKDLYVIVDEAHIAPAFGFYNIANSFNPSIIHGCTATPDRTDGRGMFLTTTFSSRYVETDPTEVKKFLTPLQYVTVNVTDIDDENNLPIIASREAVMDAAFVKILVSDMVRYHHVVYAIKQLELHGYSCVVVCGNNLWLVDDLSRALEYADIKHGIITGATKDVIRIEIINNMEIGDLGILLATTTIDIGVDITSLDAAVFPVPFSGKTVSIQRAGRIVRQAKGKKKCIIVDFKDELSPRAIGAYVSRKRHILNTFKILRSDFIPPGPIIVDEKDPRWTEVIKNKGEL